VQVKPQMHLSAGDVANTSVVSYWNHSGTHIDGPAHMMPQAGPLTEYVPAAGLWLSRPLLVDVACGEDDLLTAADLRKAAPTAAECDVLLLRTGFAKRRASDPDSYTSRNPGLSPSAAHWVLENYPGVRCIGVDTISVAAMAHLKEGIEAHRVLFQHQPPVLLIEDLNLENDFSQLQRVVVVPFFVEGLDSCACTVIAELK